MVHPTGSTNWLKMFVSLVLHNGEVDPDDIEEGQVYSGKLLQMPRFKTTVKKFIWGIIFNTDF